MRVCTLSVALGKEFTGLLEKQEGMRHVRHWIGRAEEEKGEKYRAAPALHKQAGNMHRERENERENKREKERERLTTGGRASTRLMTPSSEAFHISSPHNSVVFL